MTTSSTNPSPTRASATSHGVGKDGALGALAPARLAASPAAAR